MKSYETVCDLAEGISIVIKNKTGKIDGSRLLVEQQIKDICEWVRAIKPMNTYQYMISIRF